jgi:hypothetical protein
MVSIEEIKRHLNKYLNIGVYEDKNYVTIHVKDNVIGHLYTDGNKVILQEYCFRKDHPLHDTDQKGIKYLLSKLKYKRLVSIHPNYTVPVCLDEILGIKDD